MSELILGQLQKACTEHEDWAELLPHLNNPVQGVHLAVLNQPYLGFINDGLKTVESRFSTHRIDPFGKVAVGDLVFLKNGPVVGVFTAAWVDYVHIKTRQDFNDIRNRYGSGICAPDDFWRQQRVKRYATLIGISDVTTVEPVRIDKKDMRGWVVLRSSEPTLF